MNLKVPTTAPTQRLISLDVLRGLTIVFMIMVNNNGGEGSWGFMNHAAWNGLTPTDLVFPTFLFVVGASIVFAYQSRLRHGASKRELATHTLRRALTLFALGVFINTFPFIGIPYVRIYGVLQRIALCYLLVGLFYLVDRRVSTKIIAVIVALGGYWVLLRLVHVPGVGLPGREIPFMDEGQNLVSWLDRLLMPHHLYLDRFHNLRDPEGLLSTLPALGTTLLGLLTGLWLRTERTLRVKAAGMAVGSVTLLALGYLWAVWFPLNKNLWTSSYVLVAAGWSLALLTLTFYLCDVRGWRKGWTVPWLIFGSNAIVAYVYSELVPYGLSLISLTVHGEKTNPLQWFLEHVLAPFLPDPGWAAFAFSVAVALFCFVPVWLLYRNKIFVKV